MRDRYGADDAACRLRFHAQTAGCTLAAQQPEVNLIRVAYQALAAALGGCQSLHTNSMDETLSLPTEHAVTLALRTQQVLASETGVTKTVDPTGGSYYVESLTDQLEQEAEAYFQEIADLGGVVAGIDSGFFRHEIGASAARYQQRIESGRQVIVGVNDFVEDKTRPVETHRTDSDVEQEQIERLRRIRARRDETRAAAALDAIRRAARGTENLMPALLDAARCDVTLGEMMADLADVFGRHRVHAGWWG